MGNVPRVWLALRQIYLEYVLFMKQLAKECSVLAHRSNAKSISAATIAAASKVRVRSPPGTRSTTTKWNEGV